MSDTAVGGTPGDPGPPAPGAGPGTSGAPEEATGIAGAVHAAVRAPSPHNTQPWRFRVAADRVDVLLDERRVLAVCDPDGREAILSCGAALLNLRVTLAAEGLAHTVTLLPDRARTDLLARVGITGSGPPDARDHRLAEAVPHRHTNRRPLTDRPVAAAVRHALTEAAAAESARLVLLGAAGLSTFAALLRRADHVQNSDPRFREELAAWTHAGGSADGVPHTAGGPRSAGEPLLALRDFGVEQPDAREAHGREFERHPLVAVLTTPGDTRRDALAAGQALQRVLLTATASGLQTSFLASPVEVPETRDRLRELLGGRVIPQIALRLGHGYPGGAVTPRRPVAEVVELAGSGDTGGGGDTRGSTARAAGEDTPP